MPLNKSKDLASDFFSSQNHCERFYQCISETAYLMPVNPKWSNRYICMPTKQNLSMSDLNKSNKKSTTMAGG